jgi:hypothetical protein
MKRAVRAGFGALLWACAAWAGQISIPWSELAPRTTGKTVQLVLPDGATVQGKVRGAGSDGLLLDVSKTSDKRAHPKGIGTIPRSSVSVLQLTEYRKIGRLAFTLGSLAAAGALLSLGARDSSLEGPLVIILPVAGAAGTAGIGVGAYYFGKAVDKRVTEIRIVPGS